MNRMSAWVGVCAWAVAAGANMAEVPTGRSVAPAQPSGCLRVREIELDADRLEQAWTRSGASVPLRLFDDANFELSLERRKPLGDDGWTWSGTLRGIERGSVTIVTRNGMVTAAIRAGSHGTFEIRPAANGRHVVRELDMWRLATCGGGQGPPKAPPGARTANPRGIDLPPGVGHRCDDGSVIDLLVVYTAAARDEAGGAQAIAMLIDLAVADANAAFTRSQLATQMNLAGVAEIDYTETGDWTVDGPRLTAIDDGFLDDVHGLRDQYGADCVSLWVRDLNAGGIGYFPDTSLEGVGNSGFSMLRLDNAALLTLAHELGHNLFCDHDRPHAGPVPPFADYAYGYVEPGQAWRTIMATASTPEVIPYFANPDVNWPGPVPPNPGPTGVPEGQPEPCDVARTINQTRTIVANFRASRVYASPQVVRVDGGADPGGDGASWATALNGLSDALCMAARSAGDVQEVWVKGGTYTPDAGTGDRSATFRPVNGTGVYGGFAGGETDREQRNPSVHPTILSGDIGAPGDDADNCHHVVTMSMTDATAALDGFTITGGHADGSEPDDGGGGVLAYGGGAGRLVNCRITGNRAIRFGGGVYAGYGASPTLELCRIDDNTVDDPNWPAGGGAIYCYAGGDPVLDRCTLEDNTAGLGGGLAALFNCTPRLVHCIIRSNTASDGGGGVYLYGDCPIELTNSLFTGNSAAYGGALMGSFEANASALNCTVVGNSASASAGGFYFYMSGPMLTNCLLWANDAGGDVSEWGQIAPFDSAPVFKHCSVQGWSGAWGGVANDGSNPDFIDPDGVDNLFGTPDDNPRLSPGSSSADTGDNGALPPALVEDLDGRPRVYNGTVDRGAYELITATAGDYDGDGDIDHDDFVRLGECLNGPNALPVPLPPPTPEACLSVFDLDADSDVDLRDFAGFVALFDGP